MVEITFKEIKLRATIVIKSDTGVTLDDALMIVKGIERLYPKPEIIIANCHRVYEVPED